MLIDNITAMTSFQINTDTTISATMNDISTTMNDNDITFCPL